VHHQLVRAVAAAVVAAAILLHLDLRPAGAEGEHTPPVSGDVVDDWRPPATAHGRGNRGIDLAAAPGDAVVASADGVVTFAGRIGQETHVVVLHGDGLRTSYSFLASADVRRGEAVRQGYVLGRAAGPVHFGVRLGETYLDPLLVLDDGGPPRVHLVPEEDRQMGSEAEERRGLLRQIGSAIGGGASAALGLATRTGRLVAAHGWDQIGPAIRRLEDRLRAWDNAARAWAHVAWAAEVGRERRELRLERLLDDQEGCTPDGVATPSRPAEGRIALLVGGLGSSTGGAAVLDVDTDALGYDRTIQFSYRGGDEPYGPGDTHGDIEGYGELLRQALVDIAAEHPGVAVDVIAHSMGGLVVRAGLHGADAFAPDLPVIPNVVTLASPHHGSHWATAGALVEADSRVGATFDALRRVTGGRAPTGATSTGQLSAGSRFVHGLGDDALPAGTDVTSIAASGDWVVNETDSFIDGATNVLVPLEADLDLLNPHDALPGAADTQREIALAVAGMGPVCRDLAGPFALAAGISRVNDQRWAADAIRADLDRLPGPADLP